MPFPRGFGSSSMHVINASTLYRSLTQDQYDFCYITVNLASVKLTNLVWDIVCLHCRRQSLT